MPLQNVHIRINDAATGQPTPVRLRITNSSGQYYAPFGHAAEFPAGRGEAVGRDVVVHGERWAYMDGACEIAVPPGELTIQATKGPEYRPLCETVNLPLGKMALRFTIERCTDHRKDGWYAGDTRAHFITPHAALLEAAAEDLAIVHVLSAATPMLAGDGETYITYPNLDAFSGQSPALARDGHCVVVGTHDKHPVLGELALLHSHRVVYPLTFGGADATDDWSLGDWCDQCHRKGGFVVWTNAAPSPIGHAAEALAHAILGHVDAIELDPEHPESLQVWYQLLQAGVRIGLVGASAKRSNARALGFYRTYAQLNDRETLNPATWIEAVRAQRTCVTAGPLLRFTAERSGEEISVAAVGEGLSAIQILNNGRVAASGAEKVETTVNVDGGWLAARAWSADRKMLIAHSAAAWSDGTPTMHAGSVAALRRHLDAGRDWVEREGRFEKVKSREQLLETFDAALHLLLSPPRKQG